MISRLFLAFLATAGFFYVNIMPALVSGLIDGLGFSKQQAGAVGSANMYGAACGALTIIFLIRKIRWRPVSVALLLAIMVMDLGSMWVSDPLLMAGMRFAHGLAGGALVGTAFAVIARTRDPAKTFGVLLFVQFGLGGVGVMFLPGLVPQCGVSVLFWALIAFSLVTLMMLPFLPPYPMAQINPLLKPARPGTRWRPVLLALLAIFAFQAGNMGLYAFIIPLARDYGLDMHFITTTLGIAAWIGLAGAGLVVLISVKYGHLQPVIIGTVMTVLATAALLFSQVTFIFFVANAVIGVTWAFVISYLLGLVALFDEHGQMATIAGFASKMGLASGPALFALLVGEHNYPLIIWAAVLLLALSGLAIWSPARLQDVAQATD